MRSIDPPGANITLAEGQAEYEAMRAFYTDNTRSIHNESKEEYNSGPSFTVAFKPTPEELVSLLNGGTILMRQLGDRFRPVALWVE